MEAASTDNSPVKPRVRKCAGCGGPIPAERRSEFCSTKCVLAHVEATAAVTLKKFRRKCAVCGHEFVYRVDSEYQQHCSQGCMNESIAQQQKSSLSRRKAAMSAEELTELKRSNAVKAREYRRKKKDMFYGYDKD